MAATARRDGQVVVTRVADTADHIGHRAAADHELGMGVVIVGVSGASNGVVALGIGREELAVEFVVEPGNHHHACERKQRQAQSISSRACPSSR